MTSTSATTNNTITLAQAAAAASSTTTKKSSSFSSDDFLTMLIDQLKNQDPSSSMSEADMASQMAQYQNILELEKMSKAITTMNTTNQKLSGASMIGKTVSYTDSASQSTLSGKVDSVEFTSTDVLLNIGTKQVSLADVTGVNNGSVANGGTSQ